MGKSEYQKIIDAKKKAKAELYKLCWPKADVSQPLVMIFAPAKNEEPVFELLKGCLVLSCNVIVVSAKEPADAIRHPAGKITWVNPENGREQPKIDEYLLAADMAVVFEEHIRDIKNIMEKGAVIVGWEKSPYLQNYNPNEETGNGFTYASFSPWDIFTALVRANETYRFPFDWQNIIRGIVKTHL